MYMYILSYKYCGAGHRAPAAHLLAESKYMSYVLYA